MIALKPRIAHRKPLIAPTRTPTRTPMRIATPGSSCHFVMERAASVPESAITEPTERSIFPEIISSASGTQSTASAAPFCMSSVMFENIRKLPVWVVKYPPSTISAAMRTRFTATSGVRNRRIAGGAETPLIVSPRVR